MGLFSRWRPSRPAAQLEAIGAFWSWWQKIGAAATAAVIEQGRVAEAAAEISRRVRAIEPKLGWELGTGRGSRHVLIVTPEGDPELRAVARRWRRAAPAADDVWDYADARLPVSDVADLSLDVGHVQIDAGQVLVSARVAGAELDVSLYHPAFADLLEQQRTTSAFLLLDQALGEVEVETWVGTVSAVTFSPLDPIPLASLPAVVRELASMYTDPDGQPIWMLGEGQGANGLPVIVSAQVPLKAASAPHLDTYVGIVVPFAHRNDAGLPSPESVIPLRELEDHLRERLGGSGRIVAHQSHDGARLLHVYVDGTTPAAEQIRAAVGGWDQGKVRIQVQLDPAWSEVAHLRG